MNRFVFVATTLALTASCLQSFPAEGDLPDELKVGADALVRTGLAGEACEGPGVLLESGTDLDGDGELGDDEVRSTSVVCDGADGVDGLAGVDGSDGVDGADGVDGEAASGQTLEALACAENEIAQVDASGDWVCVSQVDADSLAALTCSDGQVVKFDATSGNFICTTDNVSTPGVDTLASLPCSGDAIPRFDGANWVCSTDRDTANTDLLADVGACGDGEVIKFDTAGGLWQCAVDVDNFEANTDLLAEVGPCVTGEVIKFNTGSGLWECGADVDNFEANTDLLADVGPCASGEVIKFNLGGGLWECGADVDNFEANTDLLADVGGCLTGEVIKFNTGSGLWECGADVDTTIPNTDLLADVGGCLTGEVIKFNTGSGLWECGADVDTTIPNTDLLADVGPCASGEVIKFNTGSGLWECGADVDTTIPNTDLLADVGGCLTGEVIKFNTGSGLWECGADVDTFEANTDLLADVGPCASGEVTKFNTGTGLWECGVDIDTTIPNTDALADLALSCADGEVAKFNAGAGLFECATDDAGGDGDTLAGLTCADGEIARFTPPAVWFCDADQDTLGALSCGVNQIAKFNGTDWACAADDAAGGGSVFTRIFIVSPTGDELVDGTTLRTTISGVTPAASASSPAKILIEPGVYDIATSSITVPEFVDVEGSGERTTLIKSAAGAGAFSPAGQTAISGLGIEMSGVSQFAVRRIAGAGGLLSLRNIRVTNIGVPSTVQAVFSNNGEVDLLDVDMVLTGGTITGITAFGGDRMRAQRVTLDLTGTNGGSGLGLGANTGGTVEVRSYRAEIDSPGVAVGLRATSGGTFKINDVDIDIQNVPGSQFSADTEGIAMFNFTKATLRDVNVRLVTDGRGVGLGAVSSGELELNDAVIRFTTQGGANQRALLSFTTTNRLSDVDIEVDGFGSAEGLQFSATGSGTLDGRNLRLVNRTGARALTSGSDDTTRIDNSIISGNQAMSISTGGTILVGSSRVQGTIGGTGAFNCFGSYDDSLTARAECP